jgi:hypothetical protein
MVEPIAALRVNGNRAYAFYHGKGHEQHVFALERVSAEWKPASLGGIPLVLNSQ